MAPVTLRQRVADLDAVFQTLPIHERQDIIFKTDSEKIVRHFHARQGKAAQELIAHFLHVLKTENGLLKHTVTLFAAERREDIFKRCLFSRRFRFVSVFAGKPVLASALAPVQSTTWVLAKSSSMDTMSGETATSPRLAVILK